MRYDSKGGLLPKVLDTKIGLKAYKAGPASIS